MFTYEKYHNSNYGVFKVQRLEFQKLKEITSCPWLDFLSACQEMFFFKTEIHMQTFTKENTITAFMAVYQLSGLDAIENYL